MNIAKRLFAWPDPIKAALALPTLLALFFVWCAVFGRGSFGFKDILPIAMMMLVSAFYGMALLPVLFGKAELEKAFGSVVSAIGSVATKIISAVPDAVKVAFRRPPPELEKNMKSVTSAFQSAFNVTLTLAFICTAIGRDLLQHYWLVYYPQVSTGAFISVWLFQIALGVFISVPLFIGVRIYTMYKSYKNSLG